jgi:hypothetical protein
MDNSLSDWLELREPADIAARSRGLVQTVAGALDASGTLHVLDLGTGTGSNLRYVAPLLAGRQHWLVIDRDCALLSLLPGLMSSWGTAREYKVGSISNQECVIRGEQLDCHVETRSLNLGSLDAPEIFAGRQLVVASALLDLVSESWLRALASRCREVGAAALFALTYNGSFVCSPAEPEDEMIRDLLNRHQKTDKGLGGLAAGPDAASCAVRCFTDVGYRVWKHASDWTLGSSEHELQRRLIDGWAVAAVELAPDSASQIAAWRARRIGHVDACVSRISVGHFDVAACPPDN